MKDGRYWIFLVVAVVMLILTGCGATSRQNLTSEDPYAVYSKMSDSEKQRIMVDLMEIHDQIMAEEAADTAKYRHLDGG